MHHSRKEAASGGGRTAVGVVSTSNALVAVIVARKNPQVGTARVVDHLELLGRTADPQRPGVDAVVAVDQVDLVSVAARSEHHFVVDYALARHC